MKREPIVLAVSICCSLAIMSWIVWSERPVPAAAAAATDLGVGATGDASTAPSAGVPADPPPVDPAQAAALEAAALADTGDPAPRVALGNLYYHAQTFEAAIPWFEEALALQPDDLDSSTNLGVCYFYAGRAERAIEQLERSLEIEPDHPQTLLNVGIVRAFALDDIEGAKVAWERVIEVAPDGREARAAGEALGRVDEMRAGTSR
jgi:TPR repeat protein